MTSNNKPAAASLFASSANVPPGTSVHALSIPILREAQFHLIRENIHRMNWSVLKTVEFEIRLGQFMLLDRDQKSALFGEQQRTGNAAGVFPPGISANNQPTQRWTAKAGFMPQTTLLAPKTFQAKMNLPSKQLFEKAIQVAENALLEASSESTSESSIPFTVTGFKKTTNTCDFKFNRADVRVSMDLETKQPSNVVDKRKLCTLDFGIALCPVDVRFAFSKETPLTNNDADREKQDKAVSFVLENFFGAERKATTATNDDVAAPENPFALDRCDQRKKDRTSYCFTITPKVITSDENNNNNATEQEEAPPADENAKNLLVMQKYFPVAGICVDLTHVIMNGRMETLEAEFEWDIVAAMDELSRASEENKDDTSGVIPQDARVLMKRVRDAFINIDANNNSSEETAATFKMTEAQKKEREEMHALRLTFLKFALGAVVRSALGMAMSLRSNDSNNNAAAGSIRQREQ